MGKDGPMARIRTDVDELAARIVRMGDAERARLLARLIVAGGRPADWSVLRDIRRRVRTRDPRVIERAAVQTTREVRRERARSA